MFSRTFDTKPLYILLLLTFMLVLMLGFTDPVGAKPIYGLGKKIIDGDSFFIQAGNKKIEVRLYGIDCPEYSQPYAKNAKLFVKKKILHKKVRVIPFYYDTYGRMVSIVKYGDKVLNKELVKAGLAWVYPRYCKKSMCKSWEEFESQARKLKRGLWQRPNPIAPWQWKR